MGETVFLAQSSETLNCVSSPLGCRLQDVFQMWCDLGPEFCLFLSSPKAGIFLFCFVFAVLFSFSSMCLGRRPFLWLLAKGNVLELPRGEETRVG